jgi:hypothetical protein
MMSSVLFLFDILLSNMRAHTLSHYVIADICPFPVLIDKFDCSHFVSCITIHSSMLAQHLLWLLLAAANSSGHWSHPALESRFSGH